jgi:hypothetical protein
MQRTKKETSRTVKVKVDNPQSKYDGCALTFRINAKRLKVSMSGESDLILIRRMKPTERKFKAPDGTWLYPLPEDNFVAFHFAKQRNGTLSKVGAISTSTNVKATYVDAVNILWK